MCKDRPSFSGMLEDLVKLGAIEFRSEPLGGIVEQRLKAIWVARSCPNCEEPFPALLPEEGDLAPNSS